MQPSRRDFVQAGIGAASLLACAGHVPAFLARSARLLGDKQTAATAGQILVVVQLDGGNDGLNTVVPYQDDVYQKSRPKLRISEKEVIKIDGSVGFHPSLSDFRKLLDGRRLAVVQGVGYPNPNRSHFTSMAIWQTADPRAKGDTPGWLARYFAATPMGGGDAPALHVHDSLLPQALAGSSSHVPSFDSVEHFQRRLGSSTVPDQARVAALAEVSDRSTDPADSLSQFVARTAVDTYATSSRLETIVQNARTDAAYPEQFELARRLRLVALCIKAGLSTSIYYTQHGGFDTHANQSGNHSYLLSELGRSLVAFVDDLKRAGVDERVLVLVFSEFGRRLAENTSGGTDHGTAAPVFLVGSKVKSGLHGSHPNLHDLADGDPKHAIDFRRIYATLLDEWLHARSEHVLGSRFSPLPLICG
jgi:uncharacterized protein (DUF1501 family)